MKWIFTFISNGKITNGRAVVSIDLCQHFSDKLKCFAFEPQTQLCEAIALSATQNKFDNITVFDIAIGAATTEIELHFASSSVHVSAVASEVGAESFTVNCYSLDDLIYIKKIPPPKLIKMDTEGGELDVFKGSQRMLKEFAPTIIFESDNNMDRWGYSREDLIENLLACVPYQFFIIRSDQSIIEYRPTSPLLHLNADIVATTDREFMSRYCDKYTTDRTVMNTPITDDKLSTSQHYAEK